MQYALIELFDYRDGVIMMLVVYWSMGGLVGALIIWVEVLYDVIFEYD